MADTFLSTGTTATFNIYADSVERTGDSLTVARSVPWGSNAVVDQSGQVMSVLTFTAYTSSDTEFSTLMTLRGGLGTLTWTDGAWTGVLKSVQGSKYMGWWRDARCEFWVTST